MPPLTAAVRLRSGCRPHLERSSIQTITGPAKKRGEIYLLKHVSCPAVLVECGFLSNPAEEALLRTPEYQKKLAAVLCCGMLEFLEEPYESC